MGKKGRRTRWRTLAIADDHSDSEESNTTASGHHMPKGYSHKAYYSKFSYSSQSTPTRRYDCSKSTRSSSTASENKITFNEDEYTRITTPRQDVLFKKGYLNKPRTYQTQTSTGNSTTSTGNNSTGNGTPDHQSTDLEYESQFVFPNGFVDQNGIYYVNSFEPYPVMVFNPPTYYPEYTNVKQKRYSTGSLTESTTSPNNEETSQEHSQSETTENATTTTTTTHHLQPVYNIVYPAGGGYYYGNGDIYQPPQEEEPQRRVKKRRKRKPSQKDTTTTSEESDDVTSEQESENPTPKIVEEQEQMKNEYKLKPDAEEFVPMAYRNQPESIPIESYIKLPPNFVPVPILNTIGDFNAFIPAGIPINFIPHHHYVSYDSKPKEESEVGNVEDEKVVEVPNGGAGSQIDIAKIVSKLEEAAMEQVKKDDSTTNVRQTRRKFKFQKVELRSGNNEKKLGSPKKVVKEQEKKEEVKRNYSETLKKSAQNVERNECCNLGNAVNKTKFDRSPKREVVQMRNVKVEERLPKVSGEWISVSRKKRRNRNVEEFEEEEEEEIKNEEEVIEEVKIEKEEVKEEIKIEEVKIEEVEEIPPVLQESLPVEENHEEQQHEEEEKKKTKKKKNQTNSTTKRVIIRDIDLSEPKKEEKVEEVIVKKEEEITIIEEEKKEPEKKIKKKKKKVKNGSNEGECCNVTNVINLTDDSYDFLLDESTDKTNVEISQELDRLIQRATFNSLEEKIKSLSVPNHDDSDFFASMIGGNISTATVATTTLNSRESSTEPQHYLKPRLLPSTNQQQPSEAYPITRAVKEWVSKTRETTPDVEIFKSPSAILREFGDEELDEEEEEDEKKEEILEELKGKYPKHGNLPYRAICCSIM